MAGWLSGKIAKNFSEGGGTGQEQGLRAGGGEAGGPGKNRKPAAW
jgi:hypothetical protein